MCGKMASGSDGDESVVSAGTEVSDKSDIFAGVQLGEKGEKGDKGEKAAGMMPQPRSPHQAKYSAVVFCNTFGFA